MANPTKYQPSYSFTGWQAYNPSRPLPAVNIDLEFQNLQLTLDEIIAALAQVRRSDGKLGNASVDLAALSDEVLRQLGGGGGSGGNVIFATKAQAEAGTSDAVVMSPLRVKEAIDRFGGGGSGGGGDAPIDILVKLLTVDGTGSGLDADLLDGQTGSFYQNAGNLTSGTVPAARLAVATSAARGIVSLSDIAGNQGAADGVAASPIAVKAVADALANKQDRVTKLAGTGITDVYTKDETNAVIQDAVASGGGGSGGGSDSAIQILEKLKTVDGGGSGLDADLLDGQSGEFYRDAGNLTGIAPRAILPDIEKDPVFFTKGDPLQPSKLFGRTDQDNDVTTIRVQQYLNAKMAFNTEQGVQRSASHIRAIAEGSVVNGPGTAELGHTISLMKEGFGTGSAKGGEIDAMYICLRQDGPRVNDANAFGQNRSDACGILIDAAFYDKTGFTGGIEGATALLNPADNSSMKRLSYQIGCINAATGTTQIDSNGLYVGASAGQNTNGLLVNAFEGAGGYFDNYIQCGTDSGYVFQIDRKGVVSIGKHAIGGTTSADHFHIGLQNDASLGFVNSNRSAQVANLTQGGNLSLLGNLNATAINTTGTVTAGGNIVAGGVVSASLLRLAPGTAGSPSSEWKAGTFSVGASGRPRICLANGQAPVFLATTNS